MNDYTFFILSQKLEADLPSLHLNEDPGSRAQTWSSDRGPNLQTAVYLVYLLEDNFFEV